MPKPENWLSHPPQIPCCTVHRFLWEAKVRNQNGFSTELTKLTEWTGRNTHHSQTSPFTNCYCWILSILLILSIPPPSAFSQNGSSYRLCCDSAITTLFFNKNSFNAILEACFFSSILKKPLFFFDVLPRVPRGTIRKNSQAVLPLYCSGFLKRSNHNRKGGAFEIEQPKIGPKGEPSGCERLKRRRAHKGECQLNGRLSLLQADYQMLQNHII